MRSKRSEDSMKNFPQIKVKVKKTYKIRISSLPSYPSTPLEMKREGENLTVKRVRKERERESGGVVLEIWKVKEKKG